MNARRTVSAAVLTTGMVAAALSGAGAADASKPSWTENCTALHDRFEHGVGKQRAHDSTSGTPVTDFKRSNKLYKKAMKANQGLDRDHDKIACEA